jgi:hypothetical protein
MVTFCSDPRPEVPVASMLGAPSADYPEFSLRALAGSNTRGPREVTPRHSRALSIPVRWAYGRAMVPSRDREEANACG